MAFGGAGGTRKPKSDINVTPLVDVVLVLLIIFLVAMPVLLRNITIDIPKKTEDEQPIVTDQITVEVQEGGIIMLNGQAVERAQLAEKLRSRLEAKREKVVFVDFHEKYRYGDAVQIMDTVKGAGATTTALKIKEPKEPGAPGAPPAPGTPPPATPPQ